MWITPCRALALACVIVGISTISTASAALISGNWSGYVATPPSGGAFTYAQASWVVPAITAPSTGTYAASYWVGLDGFNSGTVEQTGTESISVNGVKSYFAWVELYPAASVPLFSVSPGDTIDAYVLFQGLQTAGANAGKDQFRFLIYDATSNVGGFITADVAPTGIKRSSAEWIAEAPGINGSQAPLADFHSVTFTYAYAQTDAQYAADPSTIYSIDTYPFYSLNLVPPSNVGGLHAVAGPLNANGDTFTVFTPEPAAVSFFCAAIPLLARRSKASRGV